MTEVLIFVSSGARSESTAVDFALTRYNSDGSLDNSFGSQGKVVTDFFGLFDTAADIVIQPDGKILVAGATQTQGDSIFSTAVDFALTRYNSDGSLDTGFGNQGKVTTDFFGDIDIAASILLLPNGKILVGGTSQTEDSGDFALALYNPDGSLDTSFGNEGKVVTDFRNASFQDTIVSIALRTDGKILVAGTTQSELDSNSSDFALALYNPDGSLDTNFGKQGIPGKAFADFFDFSDSASSMVLLPDGKILVAGYAEKESEFNSRDFALVRYNSDGSFDSSFGNQGKVTTDFFGFHDSANSVVVLPDGKILVSGEAQKESDSDSSDFALVLYNSNGSLATSLSGQSAKIVTDFFGFRDSVNSTVLLPDGSILVAGGADKDNELVGDRDFALANYFFEPTNTLLDNSFGIQGKVVTDVLSFGFRNTTGSMVVLPDGKILVAGSADKDSNSHSGDFALVRYNSDGSLDTSFGNQNGKVITDFFGFDDFANDIVLQADGKILVAGSADKDPEFSSFSQDFALARYNSDGSLDTSFGNQNGKVITDFFGFNDLANDILIQPDGKILVLGVVAKQQSTDSLTGHRDLALARYNADGSLDSSFGNQGQVVINLSLNSNLIAAFFSSLAVQPDGKILIVATDASHSLEDSDIILFRYNSNGSLDNSFGNQGKVVTDFFGFGNIASDILIQPDGKILVAGGTGEGDELDADFALVRYNSNGSLDTTFGNQGKVVTDFFGFNDFAISMILLPDGRIAVAGAVEAIEKEGIFSSPVDFGLAIYNPDGTLDATVGNLGKETTDFLGFDDLLSSITLQSDGKILLAGSSEKDHFGDTDFSLARYNLILDDPMTNNPPTAINLTNTVTELAENSDTSMGIKVADIVITDDGNGTNNLELTGVDVSEFEIRGENELFFIGASPDFESKTQYQVTVNVDDDTVGNTPDASTNLTLSITDGVDPLLNDPLFRFQNSDRPGTYLFATEGESQNIRANFPNFIEEGFAFNVSSEEGDDLIRFNRFQNANVPGTYLYATEGESQSIRANFPNFIEEGIAFYAYGADADIGVDYYRFQNTQQPGTYIFVGESEKDSILANFPQFVLEGVAFEVAN